MILVYTTTAKTSIDGTQKGFTDMLNSENILNSSQLETEIKHFVHNFCLDKHNIHTQQVIWEVPDGQMEKVKALEISRDGRPAKEVVEEMMEEVYRYRGDSNHPRFFGFVPGPASSISWLGDIMTSAYNIHAGGSKLAPMVNCIEQKLLKWFCEQAGFGNQSGGVFVSGGSMANITALTAARDYKLNDETLHLGVAYIPNRHTVLLQKDFESSEFPIPVSGKSPA